MKYFTWPSNPIPDANLQNVADEAEKCAKTGQELFVNPETVAAIARELESYRAERKVE